MTGHQTVSRGAFRAWHFKQWRNHHLVHMLLPVHQYKRACEVCVPCLDGRKQSNGRLA